METTLREFQRNFPALRCAAKAGQSIVIRTREGERYLFSKALEASVKTFGEAASQHAGAVASGIPLIAPWS